MLRVCKTFLAYFLYTINLTNSLTIEEWPAFHSFSNYNTTRCSIISVVITGRHSFDDFFCQFFGKTGYVIIGPVWQTS